MTAILIRLAPFVVIVVSTPAFAGFPIPAPLAGAAGPAGLLAAGAVYLGYRAFKRFTAR